MARKYGGFSGHPKPIKPSIRSGRKLPSHEEVQKGLKTRIVALLLLILASSFGLWFTEFQPLSIFLWIITVFVGSYAVFEFGLFVSKALTVISVFIMELLVLEGVPAALIFGSAANLMLIAFGILDVILLYALMRL